MIFFSDDENGEIKIAKIVDDLEHVTKLNDPQMQYHSYYQRYGFMVHFNTMDKNLIAEAEIPNMKKRFKKSENLIVFNQKDSH